jgi:hypothetical protein
VLDRELNLRIKDYGENPNLNSAIRGYHGLLDDYMIRRAMQTVLHTPGQFLPVG